MDNNILTVSTDLDQIFNSSKLCIKTLGVPEPQDPSRVPDIDKNYVFPLPFLNQILLYLACPLHDCLYVSGPSGCGKTTMALQVAARLGWGVEQITLSGKSESADLIGHAALRKGELVYEYGPLVRAMRNGEILILNEIDLMPPSDLAALNELCKTDKLAELAFKIEFVAFVSNKKYVALAGIKHGEELSYINVV